MYICKFCDKACKSINSVKNHERLCKLNPDRSQPTCGMLGKKGGNQFTKAAANGTTFTISDETRNKISLANSKRSVSEETRAKLSLIACSRAAKHSKYSKNTEYKLGVILESSYEVEVAKILDLLGIEWEKVRRGFVWDDNGKHRRYIPDFYLPSIDVYLDPKNDFLIKRDQKKISSATALNKITVIVLSKAEITLEYIEQLVNSYRSSR